MSNNTDRYKTLAFLIAITAISIAFASAKNDTVIPHKQTGAFYADTVVIKHADKTRILRTNDSTTLMILVGNVIMQQGKTIFKCDSCVKNDKAQLFEAWRNVHINDNDTTNIYASHLRYLSDKQLAYLDGGTKLTDGHTVLTTPDLIYDMNFKTATYKNGGKVVNKKTTITSKEAVYYTDMKDAIFRRNVVVKDPGYDITADSLAYNTNSQVARFISKTNIKDTAGNKIDTREGSYNLRTGEANFGQRPKVVDKNNTTIEADELQLDKNIAKATGNAIIIDSKRGTTIIGNLVFQNRNTEAVLATQKPLMIIKQDKDSTYIAADTLFSAKLTDLYGAKPKLLQDSSATTDSLKGKRVKKDNDSTNRYFEAYRNVRIFNDSSQAISDSLFYSFKDSIFRLYQNPVVWGKDKNQITGDTILLHTKNKKPSHFESIDNSFVVSWLEGTAYNQIKSSRMDGYFVNGDLDSVRAKGGPAESIYFVQDKDSAYVGIDQSTSDMIDAYFKKKQLYKIVKRGEVKGSFYPIRQKRPSEMRLTGFRWLEAHRPKSATELFQ